MAGSRRCQIGNRWLNLRSHEHSQYRSGARIFGPARSGIRSHPRQRPPYYGACRPVPGNGVSTKHYCAKAFPKLPARFQLALYNLLPLISDCGNATQRNVWARVKHRIVKSEIRVPAETEGPPPPDRHICDRRLFESLKVESSPKGAIEVRPHCFRKESFCWRQNIIAAVVSKRDRWTCQTVGAAQFRWRSGESSESADEPSRGTTEDSTFA
jgi:hypothetical protein